MTNEFTEAEQACVDYYQFWKDKRELIESNAIQVAQKVYDIGKKLDGPQTFEVTRCPNAETGICKCGQTGHSLCKGARIILVEEVENAR